MHGTDATGRRCVTIRRRPCTAGALALSYIDAHDVLTLTAVLAALTWFGFLVDASRLGKVLPGVACILLAGVVLSNLHITPFSSGVSDFVGQYVVAAAIPLLMIKADLKKIFLESGRVMVGFGGRLRRDHQRGAPGVSPDAPLARRAPRSPG